MSFLDKYVIPLMFILFGIICIIKPKIAFDMEDTNPHSRSYSELMYAKQYKAAGIIIIIVGIFAFLLGNEII